MKKHFLFSIIFFSALILSACSQKTEILPSEIYHLKLKQKITGKQAAKFINRLHPIKVANTENQIGFYKGENGTAVIYVTQYPDKKSAVRDEQKMTEKIAEVSSMFTLGKRIDINGREIYRIFGMGKTHFVFAINNKLFWITAESTWAVKFLKEYLKNFN